MLNSALCTELTFELRFVKCLHVLEHITQYAFVSTLRHPDLALLYAYLMHYA